MMDMPPIPPEQVIEQKLADCGLIRTGLSIAYSELLQSIEIVIDQEAGLTKEQFACLREAAGTEIVTIRDPKLQIAYLEFGAELVRPIMLESARKTLMERGLLEGFPEREAFPTLRAFGEALELHCGFPTGTVLKVAGETLTVMPQAMQGGPMKGKAWERFTVLMASLMYIAARDGNVKVGFIGNEAFRPDSK